MKKTILLLALMLLQLSFAQQSTKQGAEWILNPPKDDYTVSAIAREDSKLEAFISAFGNLVDEMEKRFGVLQQKPDKKLADLFKNISAVRKAKSQFQFGSIAVHSENGKTSIIASSKTNSISIEYSFGQKSTKPNSETLSIVRNGLSEKNLYQAIKNSGVEMTHVVSTEREEEKHYVLLVFRP